MTQAKPPLGAAIDLGSNSFHLILAELWPAEVRIVERRRERVRLAGGLNGHGELSLEAQLRALDTLDRFGESTRDLPAGNVRIVGTNTFRKARNVRRFMERAEERLGHPIEIISGSEEARLIYMGVSHLTKPTLSRRLVIDIGGGSTECIVGEGLELLSSASIQMGCVSFSQRFFENGRLDDASFERAITAARVKLTPLEKEFGSESWTGCLGSSGTIHAIGRVCEAEGWSNGSIPRDGVERLRDLLLSFGEIAKIDLPRLKPDRLPVLPGGLAIVAALMESFGILEIDRAPGGLREGLLNDLHSRILHRDVRDQSVRKFGERFRVDERQARRVQNTALGLFDQVGEDWQLDAPLRRYLSWSARLHEVGLQVSHIGYHKHGEYLVEHSDLPGFSNDDLMVTAALVRGHRKKIPLTKIEGLAHVSSDRVIRTLILLRIAVLLHRARSGSPFFSGVKINDSSKSKYDGLQNRPIQAIAQDNTLELKFDQEWVAEHPVVMADLDREAEYLATFGYTVRY